MATACGGCRGEGSHRRWCKEKVGLMASIYGPRSEQLQEVADLVGSNNPGLANQLYTAAADMEAWARSLVKP